MKIRNLRSVSRFAWPLVAVLALDSAIFALHWDQEESSGRTILNPPGWLVGVVWVGLILLMSIAAWRLSRSPSAESNKVGRWIVWLIILCLSYPFYTLGLKSHSLGLAGNIATFAMGAFIMAKAWPLSRASACLLIPILAWLAYATATLV